MRRSMITRICFIMLSLVFITLHAELQKPNIEYCSYALTQDGKVVGYYGEKARVEIKNINQISKHVINGLLATEDRNFYSHDGVSYKGLGRAVAKTMIGDVQGGSTITMQLARNLFLTFDQTISRKLTEIKIAKEIEAVYTKNEILLMYLNTIYYGNSVYGLWAASQEYFSKTPDKLDIHESALIIGILNAPVAYDPVKHGDKALARRNIVLSNMYKEKFITQSEYNKAKSLPLDLNMREKMSGFFQEYVRLEANKILKRFGKNLSDGNLIVETTLDSRAQKAAGKAVKEHWKQFPKNMQDAQFGLVSVDVKNGEIKALIGGNPKARHTGLNRAINIRRQPGSSFKPFLYSYLLKEGYNLATPLQNVPIVADSGEANEWRPRNEDNHKEKSETVTMLRAIQRSVNLAAAYSVLNLTNADSIANFSHTLGIKSSLLPVPSLVLGTSDVSPLEMASSYSVFASGGYLSEPWAIVKIKDFNGRVYYSGSPSEPVQVLDPETCYLTTYALQNVVNHGTGYSARRYYRGVIAGKTGTTQNSVDAWFVGYNTELATAIWVGFDSPRQRLNASFGYGGSACAPIFGLMYLELAKQGYPGMKNGFTPPENIQEAEFCTETGMLATENCLNKIKIPYNTLFESDYCTKHPSTITEKPIINPDNPEENTDSIDQGDQEEQE